MIQYGRVVQWNFSSTRYALLIYRDFLIIVNLFMKNFIFKNISDFQWNFRKYLQIIWTFLKLKHLLNFWLLTLSGLHSFCIIAYCSYWNPYKELFAFEHVIVAWSDIAVCKTGEQFYFGQFINRVCTHGGCWDNIVFSTWVLVLFRYW